MRSLYTAVVASLALHALVVLVVNLPHLIPLPKSPLEIEVLPYERPKPKPVDVPPPPGENARYVLATRVCKLLPLAVTRVVGPPLVRHIP